VKHLKHLKQTLANATSTYCLDENRDSSTQSSTPVWSSMLPSGAEVAGVKHVGGTNLGRGHGKRMERDRNERRKYRRERRREGEIHPVSRGARRE
jgi:hypothetical protein